MTTSNKQRRPYLSRSVRRIVMEPAITTDIVVAYAHCPRKAYLLLFSPDKGEPHEYVQILGQQRCANQERYIDHLQQTHADVQPYSVENLRKGSKVLINAHLQDRKSTRLNSSHVSISYAVFCLKKKKKNNVSIIYQKKKKKKKKNKTN